MRRAAPLRVRQDLQSESRLGAASIIFHLQFRKQYGQTRQGRPMLELGVILATVGRIQRHANQTIFTYAGSLPRVPVLWLVNVYFRTHLN